MLLAPRAQAQLVLRAPRALLALRVAQVQRAPQAASATLARQAQLARLAAKASKALPDPRAQRAYKVFKALSDLRVPPPLSWVQLAPAAQLARQAQPGLRALRALTDQLDRRALTGPLGPRVLQDRRVL